MEMDALQTQLKRLALACLLLCAGIPAVAQTVTIQRVSMDNAKYGNDANPAVKELMDHYGPQLHEKMEAVVAYTVEPLERYQPESPLSNMAADALLEIARRKYGMDKVDFSLTNFGGIRTDLPKGNIKLYDVYSVFPFENTMVIVELPGKQVKQLFDSFAKRHPEVLGGVKLRIDDHKITELLINGKPLDENRVYNVATIDFLLSGGDNVTALKDNNHVEESGITIRDVILEYMKTFQDHGEPLPSRKDGRVIVNNPER